MLLNLMDNDEIKSAFKSIDTIVNAVFDIIAAVEDYPGSEFCSGLLFGVSGSNLILQLGREIVSGMESME